MAEHIPARDLLRGVYDRELPHAAFLREGKTMIVSFWDVRMDHPVEDHLIVYLCTNSVISYCMITMVTQFFSLALGAGGYLHVE